MMIAIFWVCRRARPGRLARVFRRLQMVSAGFMALSHGSNDAQKTMGIIAMSLAAYGGASARGGRVRRPRSGSSSPAPSRWGWARRPAACGSSRRWGRRSSTSSRSTASPPRPGAAITILAASHLGMPVSTTHVISGAIMGVGSSQRVSAVRWGVTARILWAWVLTIPISAATAWGCYVIIHALSGR